MFATKRLSKELSKIHQGLAPGISLVSADDFNQWQMDIQVLDDTNTLYAGKKFRLNFKFQGVNYPIEAPIVTFIRAPDREIPIHPHIYSNGVICLDLLSSGHGWTPVSSVETVCMSIQSMLTSNTKNERPEGDEQFVRRTGLSGPRGVHFVYDDHTI